MAHSTSTFRYSKLSFSAILTFVVVVLALACVKSLNDSDDEDEDPLVVDYVIISPGYTTVTHFLSAHTLL